MLDKSNLHEYQVRAINHAIRHPRCGLFIPLGAGKTISTLTVAAHNLNSFITHKILLIAPLRVANSVWHTELKNWSHTQHITYSICTGTLKQRVEALEKDAQLTIINRENIKWLVEYYREQKGTYTEQHWPYDMLIIDESSSFKNHSTQRFKAIRKILPHTSHVILLSATPSPNGLHDLWSQIFILDKGERLHKTITAFRNRWFEKDFMGFSYQPRSFANKQIKERISDICFNMEDVVQSKRIDINRYADFTPKVARMYKEAEDEFIAYLDSGEQIEIMSAAAKSNKLLQICNGNIYDENGKAHHVHDIKMEMLTEVLEEAQGEPVLVAYNFRSDLERILEKFPIARVLDKNPKTIDEWNNKEIPVLLAHPACLSHDTEVLTEKRGWVKITEVLANERVFDGIEFVSHDGFSYSGFKQTIEVFGVRMTKNHKLLIDEQWVKAKDVRDSEDFRRANYKYKGGNRYLKQMCQLRSDIKNNTTQDRKTYSKENVYDLVNCGPRNRFLIRNKQGEIFISKNSAGHGLNLQHGGSIIVWVGLNWSLELYQQFVGRLDRQGQKHTVRNIHLMIKGTIDDHVMGAIQHKAKTQKDLLKYLQEKHKR